MKIYVVIVNNGEEYPEDFIEQDVCGVFSSLELAKRQEAPKGWKLDRIEVWRLDGGYIGEIDIDDEEEEENE